MRRLQVESTSLAEVGYDRQKCQLEVVFRQSREVVYTYQEVAPELFLDLLQAVSLGSYLAHYIKPNHQFSKRPNLIPTRKPSNRSLSQEVVDDVTTATRIINRLRHRGHK